MIRSATKPSVKGGRTFTPRNSGIARVLLADDNPASRLTLKTVLEAGGYRVDAAASASEAVGMLDESEYSLVLTDLSMESPESGLKVLAHARMKEYKPATAVVTSWNPGGSARIRKNGEMLIEPQGVPELLGQVATLISKRASKRLVRSMRQGT